MTLKENRQIWIQGREGMARQGVDTWNGEQPLLLVIGGP